MIWSANPDFVGLTMEDPKKAARLVLACSADSSAGLQLKDSLGQSRLIIGVDAEGQSSVRLMDDKGSVLHEIK
jgi:hypothetical protein